MVLQKKNRFDYKNRYYCYTVICYMTFKYFGVSYKVETESNKCEKWTKSITLLHTHKFFVANASTYTQIPENSIHIKFMDEIIGEKLFQYNNSVNVDSFLSGCRCFEWKWFSMLTAISSFSNYYYYFIRCVYVDRMQLEQQNFISLPDWYLMLCFGVGFPIN